MWAGRQNYMLLFWLLFAVLLAAGLAVQAYGPVVPRMSITLASVAKEFREMHWSPSFLFMVGALAALSLLLVLYAGP